MDRATSLQRELVLAWRQHWPYFKFALALFAVGTILGILLVDRVDLFALMGFENIDEIFPEELTATRILVNNSLVFLLALLGVFTFGILTATILLFNGLLVGYVLTPIANEFGIDVVIVGIVPHGILELPAFFVAAAVTFRVLHLVYLRVRRRRDRLFEPGDTKRIGYLLIAAWIVLAIAAFVEMYVTFWLLETIYPEFGGP